MAEDFGTGLECARRCLAAMGETQDVETRFSLRRAAAKYASKDRVERRAGDFGSPLPHAWGEDLACEGETGW